MVLQWILGYMCLFQFWFPQSICLDVVLLGHMVTFHTYLFSYTVVSVFIHSVQSLSHVQLIETLWTAACQASLSMTKQHIKTHVHESCHAQTHVHWVGDAVQPSHPLSSLSATTFNLSQHQGLFQWVSSAHQVAQVLKFQLQHQTFKFPLRLTGLISFLAQGLSRVFSNSSNASILQHSAFFMVQLSHPYMITGKTIALTRWTFVGQVMSLVFLFVCLFVF